ncbi:DNA alkylation repair protein [Gimesia fumaroli]|uniref:DNA alkylation repair enzyme n=1 Tax=Gimesia fumaroli TaxID=2527976 RepID=A0A518IF16_9PLAN|nr:DNA alkylation repair protein [Gimesia fumaroli]QDV51692.1 DNA alkylation repair enzyme [Gimesia fumaroli]
MTVTEIVAQLEKRGSDSTKKVLINHGAKEPVLGVKVADLKKIQKQVKQNYQLALDLFDTGIYDAQYLAGLIADDAKMTKPNLRRWLTRANCMPISGTTVAWVTAESSYGHDLALEWIAAKKEAKAQAGWMTLCSLISIKDDSELDLPEIKQLLKQIEQTIHEQPNMVRYAMNNFVISTGCYISSLTKTAIQTAKKIGTVTVDMGQTACNVPSAVDYIQKVEQRGTIGKKRKTARC